MTRVIQQLPQNATSANTAEVYTNTGFNQGDLVYYQNGDYKSQANLTAPTNVPFSATSQTTTFANGTGGFATTMWPTSTTTNTFGAAMGDMAATLTNGNIVQVGRSYDNGYAIFRIVSTTGTVVVATTTIATTPVVTQANITVVALTGGGFAVGWYSASPTANSVAYAVYSNTGTVVTAATSDATGQTLSTYSRVLGTALANGGFVLSTTESATNNILYKIYTSTGGTTLAWTVGTTPLVKVGYNNQHGIASRSDSSFILFGQTATASYQYIILSATGTILKALTPVTPTNSVTAAPFCDVATLADGTTFVLAWSYTGTNAANANNYYITAFNFLPTGNTLGTQQWWPYTNYYSQVTATSPSYGIKVVPQASGGFAIFAYPDPSGMMACVFHSSSGAVLSGTSGTTGGGALPIYFPFFATNDLNNGARPTVLEYGGNLNVFVPPFTNSPNNATTYTFSISTSTYQAVPLATNTSASIANVYSGAGTKSSSTPTQIKYLASTTESLSALVPTTTGIPIGVAVNTPCYNYHACVLSNGYIVIAYMQAASPYGVFVNVYTSTGNLISTQQIGNSVATAVDSSSGCNNIRVSALNSGKFVVAYLSATTTITANVFSSTFVLTSRTTQVATSTVTSPGGFDVVGLSTDRFVLFYLPTSATTIAYIVYSNTCTVVQASATAISASSLYGVCGFTAEYGGFGVTAGSTGATTQYYSMFYQSGASAYTAANSSTAVTSGVGAVCPNIASVNSNAGLTVIPAFISTNSPTFNTYGTFNASNVSAGNTITFGQSITARGCPGGAGGMTGNGSYTILSCGTYAANATPVTFYGLGIGLYRAAGAAIASYSLYSSSYATTLPLAQTTPNMFILPSYGFNNIITFLDANLYINIGFYNSFPYNYPVTVTSGSTISNAVPINSSTNTNNYAVSGAVLAGVAATTATAGSTGQLVINGQAVLNSTYPATLATQGFDYQGQGTLGVRGTIINRNVNLQGNS